MKLKTKHVDNMHSILKNKHQSISVYLASLKFLAAVKCTYNWGSGSSEVRVMVMHRVKVRTEDRDRVTKRLQHRKLNAKDKIVTSRAVRQMSNN